MEQTYSSVEKAVILFVDDDNNFLQGISRLLYKEPYEILTAPSASDATEILDSRKVDVLISDQNMPLINGTELFAFAKSKHPSVIRILLTGSDDLSVAVNAINDGQIYKFLQKPCRGLELGIAIRQSLEQRDLKKFNNN
jgi:DNA-binding NtrC family response regulator